MINQQILDFIKQQTALGKSKDEIKQALRQVGWQEADIEEGFKAVEQNLPAPAMAAPGTAPGGPLPGPVEILKNAWEIYKQRLGVFLGIYLIPYLIIMGLSLLAAGIGFVGIRLGNPFIFVLVLVIVAAMIYLGIWSEAALIFAIKDNAEKISIGEAYKRAKGRIGALFVVSLLTGLAVIGGMILLIIPGLIFAVWFSQTSYVAVLEGISGTEALSKSKQYISGRFWPVAGRLAFVVLISILVSIVLGFVGNLLFGSQDNAAKTIFSGIINILLVPLVAVYTYLLYSHLKSTMK